MKINIHPSYNLQDTPEDVATNRLKDLLLSSIPEKFVDKSILRQRL